MDRNTLRALAISKRNDAELLFQNARHSNAYYLFGYAVEIAIKARISRLFRAETLPDRKLVNATYTHNLNDLIGTAGLAEELRNRRNGSPAFDSHWSTVADWNETTRYDIIDVFTSTAMRNAMMDGSEGVFQWLQQHW
jgi:hypothetical protein